MTRPFDDRLRETIRGRLDAFDRQVLPNHHDASAGGATTLKRAAVAIMLLKVGDHAGFILTRRASRLRAHGGQWALPGGRCDAGESATEAAAREMHEEIGVRLPPDAALGVLDDYPTRSGYLITPVVFWAAAPPRMVPNPTEVASVHRIGLDQILVPDAVDFIEIPESRKRVIRIRINGTLVHAPTAAVLYQFSELLAGRVTRVSDLEQPVFAWR